MLSPALKALLWPDKDIKSELLRVWAFGSRLTLSVLLAAMERTTSAEPFFVLSAYFTIILCEPVLSAVPEMVPLENPFKNGGSCSKEKVPLTSPLA